MASPWIRIASRRTLIDAASPGDLLSKRAPVSEAQRILATVLRAAEIHDGIFHVDDARKLGMSPSAANRLVTDGVLERVAPGHLRAAHLTWTLRARQRQALIRVGAGSALAGRTALHHWQIGPRPDRIEILAPRGQKRQRSNVKVIQSTDIVPVDITSHRRLSTATPVRALIDAARSLSPLALEQAVSRAVEAGHLDLADLELRFREIARRGRPGVRRMRACLATFGSDPHANVFEKALETIIDRAGFVRPFRQYRVAVDGHVYFLDHCWPAQKKWSECDSMLAHGSAEALRRDLERQNRIIAATGFEPMRFTWFDVHERPDYVIEILARHLPRIP